MLCINISYKVHVTGWGDRRYLFDNPKNDIYYINKSTIKHKGFVFTWFLVQIYLLGSGTLRR